MRLKSDFSVELEPEECKDRHMLLKRKFGFWLLSLEPMKYKGFLTQVPSKGSGLHTKLKDKYWKFLSSLLFRIECEGENEELELTRVKAYPSKMIYHYKSDRCLLKVEYCLLNKNWKNTGARVKFKLEPKTIKKFQLIVSPLLNIKKKGDTGNHFYEIQNEEGLIIKKNEKEIGFYPEGKFYKENGGRKEEDFSEENPLKIGEIMYDLDREFDLYIVCGKNVSKRDFSEIKPEEEIGSISKIMKKWDIQGKTSIEKLLHLRGLALSNLITERAGMEIPEGDFNEIFEGLYHNLNFYRNILGDNNLNKIFLWGSLFLSNEKNGNLKDNLIYLLSLGKHLSINESKVLKEIFKNEVLKLLGKTNGNLMLSTDVKHTEKNRIQKNWDRKVLLPEINARWVKVLEKFDQLTGKTHSLNKAKQSFKTIFWNGNNYLYNAVMGEEKDEKKSVYGLIGLSLLPELFEPDEMERAHKLLKNGFVVKRKPLIFERKKMPFGLLNVFQEGEDKISLDKIPYLCKFLKHLGKENEIEQIMVNILDHQISDGILFYSHNSFKPEYNENPLPNLNSISIASNHLEPFISYVSELSKNKT